MPSIDVPAGKLSEGGMGPEPPEAGESASETDDESSSSSPTVEGESPTLPDTAVDCPSTFVPAAPQPAIMTSRATANTVANGFIS
jgi:hypothetical protein